MDRYLSYVPAKSEAEYYATAAACTMISLKIRRARRECLNYKHLQAHFSGISETNIRVSMLACVLCASRVMYMCVLCASCVMYMCVVCIMCNMCMPVAYIMCNMCIIII